MVEGREPVSNEAAQGTDPSRNVGDLVGASERHQGAMRAAETVRIDQLAALRRDYETQISTILSAGVKDKSDLVSSQLVQIQSTFDTRVAKLEEFRLTQIGRSSVADPALAAALASLASEQIATRTDFTKALDSFAQRTATALEAMATSIAGLKLGASQSTGEIIGKREMIAWGAAAAGVLYYIFVIGHAFIK